MAYSLNRNYQDEINKAVSSGDYALASRLEKERNEKIDGESLSYEKTYNYQKPEGITDATYNAMNKQYTASDKQQQLDANKQNAGNKVTNLTNKSNIVSSSTWADIESEFKTPTAVKQADAYLADQLKKIQSGRTSYTEQLQEAMDKILNREKFSYDVDTDPLFQQALASAMGSGKQAMQDTIGQASALTGGYGSSYATTAGNQAYNAYIQDAYDNLPQYYQMAREAYEAEGDELYRQYSMFSTEDEKEYNRNITAFDATSQYRNQLYNEAYGQYRDSKSDAFATANLEISEHGQLVSDAVNAYNIAANLADTEYERNYQSWLDSINIAMQKGQIERGTYEYDKTFAENVRQYEESKAFQKEQFEHQKYVDSQNIAQGWASINARGSGGGGGGGDDTFELDNSEVKEIKSLLASGATEGEILDYLYNKGKVPDDMTAFTNLINTYRNQTTKEKNTPTNIGTLNGFKTDKGDNFDIVVNGKSYGVENHGKVTNDKTLKKLEKYDVSNNNAFVHDGTIYVKKKGEYYKVGAYWTGGDNLAKAVEALSKKSK
jgi:hypothetical protein